MKTKTKFKKWDLINLKTFHSKGNHRKMERQPVEWGKYLQMRQPTRVQSPKSK